MLRNRNPYLLNTVLCSEITPIWRSLHSKLYPWIGPFYNSNISRISWPSIGYFLVFWICLQFFACTVGTACSAQALLGESVLETGASSHNCGNDRFQGQGEPLWSGRSQVPRLRRCRLQQQENQSRRILRHYRSRWRRSVPQVAERGRHDIRSRNVRVHGRNRQIQGISGSNTSVGVTQVHWPDGTASG